jgi:hypothetical protein
VPVEKLQTESCINQTQDKKMGRSRRVAWGKESRGDCVPKTTSLRCAQIQHEPCRATAKRNHLRFAGALAKKATTVEAALSHF